MVNYKQNQDKKYNVNVRPFKLYLFINTCVRNSLQKSIKENIFNFKYKHKKYQGNAF